MLPRPELYQDPFALLKVRSRLWMKVALIFCERRVNNNQVLSGTGEREMLKAHCGKGARAFASGAT